ncbi:hypothetical protein FRX31_017209 [Thalictrum thalictroides]|uniref:Uncharacterized protein n=1 Tax=Thalictrum thalictroides TaxID=46969 RepID=A0A7J6W741_THATH|nr:hypothetical protein FRX31_017209 [Thalictrum thalictroides]
MEFDRYNVPQYGNVSFENQSMTQILCPNGFYGTVSPPYIQNFNNGTHVSSNGEFSHENEPNRNNGANSSLQAQFCHCLPRVDELGAVGSSLNPRPLGPGEATLTALPPFYQLKAGNMHSQDGIDSSRPLLDGGTRNL